MTLNETYCDLVDNDEGFDNQLLADRCEIIAHKYAIKFAKMHVKKALKQASEQFKMKIRDNVHELDMNDDWMEVDKESILNAYSLDNIV